MVKRDKNNGNFLKGHKININRKHTLKALESYRKAGKRRKKLNLPKDFWIKEYVVNKKSSLILAKEFGVCKATILKELKRFNIERRTNSESHIGNTLEKLHGKEKAEEMRIKQSKIMTGRSISTKGKTYEEIYGKETAKRLKMMRKENILFLLENTDFLEKSNSKEARKKLSKTLKEGFSTGRIIKRYEGHTKHTHPSLKLISISMKGKRTSIKSEFKKGHKRGMLGKKQKQSTIKKIKERRRKQVLPIKDTSIEVKIQNFLKQLGIEFFTHQYIKIEHGYQCDILIPSMNLVIECDGDYWHKYPIGNDLDHVRTKELIEKGFKVLRLWEFEIKAMDLNDFEERIK